VPIELQIGDLGELPRSSRDVLSCPSSHKTDAVEQIENARLVSTLIDGTGSIFKGNGEVPIIEAPLLARTNIPGARRKLRPQHRFPDHLNDTHSNDNRSLTTHSRICANGVRKKSNFREPRIANGLMIHSALIDPMSSISFGIRDCISSFCSQKQWLRSMATGSASDNISSLITRDNQAQLLDDGSPFRSLSMQPQRHVGTTTAAEPFRKLCQ
jgi:hypothetical protein